MIILKRIDDFTLVFLWSNGSIEIRKAPNKEVIDELLKSYDIEVLDNGNYLEFQDSDYDFLFQCAYELEKFLYIESINDYIHLEKNIEIRVN